MSSAAFVIGTLRVNVCSVGLSSEWFNEAKLQPLLYMVKKVRKKNEDKVFLCCIEFVLLFLFYLILTLLISNSDSQSFPLH